MELMTALVKGDALSVVYEAIVDFTALARVLRNMDRVEK